MNTMGGREYWLVVREGVLANRKGGLTGRKGGSIDWP